MKKTFIYLAALSLVAAACSKEFNAPETTPSEEVQMITETIIANNGDSSTSTRAGVDADAKFYWTAGDQVAVHVSDGNYYTTAELLSGGTNSATFSITYPDGQSRDAFAIYPASIVAADAAQYGQSGTPLAVTLPGSYAIADVSGEKTPCPMIAANTPGGDWTFKQLCGMLRLTVNNIPAEATYLKIDFNDKKVQGHFIIASTVTPGTSVIATYTTDVADDIITITGLTGASSSYDINLPLPTGKYSYVNVTAYNSSNVALLAITRPLNAGNPPYTISRAKGRKITALLHGLFSVGASSQVDFAFGNLQASATAQGESWDWRFAQHQWDKIGSSNNIISGDGTITPNTGSVDLFGWVGHSNTTWDGELGTKLNAAMHGVSRSTIVNDADYYGNVDNEPLKSDWGKTISSSWCTLTLNEWVYVFDTRTTPSDIRYAFAKVNGVNGIILLPDDWSSGYHTLTQTNTNAPYNSNVVSAVDWANDFEPHGVVFLPAAGERQDGSVTSPDTYGRYWSATSYVPNVERAWAVIFASTGLSTTTARLRYYGQSVRLVRRL